MSNEGTHDPNTFEGTFEGTFVGTFDGEKFKGMFEGRFVQVTAPLPSQVLVSLDSYRNSAEEEVGKLSFPPRVSVQTSTIDETFLLDSIKRSQQQKKAGVSRLAADKALLKRRGPPPANLIRGQTIQPCCHTLNSMNLDEKMSHSFRPMDEISDEDFETIKAKTQANDQPKLLDQDRRHRHYTNVIPNGVSNNCPVKQLYIPVEQNSSDVDIELLPEDIKRADEQFLLNIEKAHNLIMYLFGDDKFTLDYLGLTCCRRGPTMFALWVNGTPENPMSYKGKLRSSEKVVQDCMKSRFAMTPATDEVEKQDTQKVFTAVDRKKSRVLGATQFEDFKAGKLTAMNSAARRRARRAGLLPQPQARQGSLRSDLLLYNSFVPSSI